MALLNIIIKSLWPLVSKFFQPKIENQNYYNEEKHEKKAIKITEAKAKTTRITKSHFVYPVLNRIFTSYFGFRKLKNVPKKASKRRWHNGLDLIGSVYTLIAPEDLVITKILHPHPKHPSRFKKVKGKWIQISKDSYTPYIIAKAYGVTHKFYHVSISKNLVVGCIIKVGTPLGKYGQYGYCFGAHLHWEVWKEGAKNAIDPLKYSKKRMAESD